MRARLLSGIGLLLLVAGVLLLGASAYAMYRLGTSSSSTGNPALAREGIAEAVGGAGLFLIGLGAIRWSRDDQEDAPRTRDS